MLGISLGLTARLNSSAFNPLSLFGLTDTGWVYDHSDFSTLFQDAAGTIPVTAVGQPVGLQLDKSKGLVLGPELVTNGTFDTDTSGWASSTLLISTAAVVSGEFQVTASVASGRQVSAISCVVGKTYLVVGSCRLISGTGSAFIGIADTLAGASIYGAALNNTSTPIQTRAQFVATATTMYVVAGSTGGSGVTRFDNISVREIPGNHRTQSISLNRPTLLQDDGGLYYLSYDGINDSMATASFAWGTDKVTVVAGVRKLWDAAPGVVTEFSASVSANLGSFGMFAPGANSGVDAQRITFTSLGSTSVVFIRPIDPIAAPVTAVVSGLGNISGDLATLRINGTQVAQSTADQGTGNYGTYQVFFGARGGTSFFFNGREYRQFAINRLLTTDELAQIEAYTNSKTGAY